MRSLKIIFFLAVIVLFSSCGKKDEKVNSENQSSTQNVAPNTQQNTNSGTVNKKWAGQYTFEESAKNVTGDGAQTWNYVIDIKEKDANTLIADIQVDGFQTMTRIEASVKATEKNAEVIFEQYGKDNMFELYKKGDRLFTIEANDKGEIITNWDKMKPNVIENQKSGKIMFKKIAS
ncbi:MAG: hypothetical protein IAE93_01935 [Ignavibacteria bacterium]|nr:hypothetical protein [Ignavibacteria bacterium]